jgi:hypothetical protein
MGMPVSGVPLPRAQPGVGGIGLGQGALGGDGDEAVQRAVVGVDAGQSRPRSARGW